MATTVEGRGGDAGARDIEITADWASFAHWTPAQRALKIQQDGERRQAQQVAESTGRLVARLVADMVAAERDGDGGLGGLLRSALRTASNFRNQNGCHPGSPAGAVRDPGDRAEAVHPPLDPGQALRAFRDDNEKNGSIRAR